MKKSQDKSKLQDEVDNKVIINNIQEILPSIPVQSKNIAVKDVDLLKKTNPDIKKDDNSVISDHDSGNSVENPKKNKGSSSTFHGKCFTPDLVPKSFQDKR